MRTGIFSLICIHMLLWAGCQSTLELHKVRSIEDLPKRPTDSTQINRLYWRKLLEENVAANSNAKKEETMNASASIEPKSVNETNATTSLPGKDDVQDVKKDTVTADAKKEEGKSDPAPLIAQKEGGESEGVAARADASKVEEPKSQLNEEQERPEVEVLDQKDTRVVEKQKVEVSKIDSNAHSQAVQIEERSTSPANESVTKEQEQADQTPDKKETSGEKEPQDNPATESSNLRENVDSKEVLADVNPIKMVANTSSDVKEMDAGDAEKVVLTAQPEELVKEKITLDNASASEEKADNPNNSTDGSNEVTSNTGDGGVDDVKVEDKNESSASLEIKEEKREDGQEVVSQVEGDEKVDEKQEGSESDGDKQSESNETGSSEEKADENHDSSDGNVGTKDDESEENNTRDISSVLKADDETEAATKEVESQLEELKRGTVIETVVEQTKERDLSEDEYDIIQELADLPTKFQETAGKVADHLRPDVIKWTDTSKVYFNRANQQITESFSPLIGKQYAPFIASMVSYGVLLLPLIVVILLFDHIKALFSLQKVLLFINIYLAAYFATLWLASFIIGLEPMSFFYSNSLSSYLSLQLLQGLGYVIYLILQTANIFHACTSDTLAGKITSTLQWIVATAIGLHYYVTVFHPAVASKPPHTSWKFYAIYTAAFFILCLFARIRWVKKQYVTSGSNIGDKKS